MVLLILFFAALLLFSAWTQNFDTYVCLEKMIDRGSEKRIHIALALCFFLPFTVGHPSTTSICGGGAFASEGRTGVYAYAS